MRVRLRFDAEEEAIQFALSFGGRIEVIEPDELRAKVLAARRLSWRSIAEAQRRARLPGTTIRFGRCHMKKLALFAFPILLLIKAAPAMDFDGPAKIGALASHTATRDTVTVTCATSLRSAFISWRRT